MTSTAPACARMVATDTNTLLAATFDRAGARRLLDVGCGYGETTAHLAGIGFDVLGIDPSPAAISQARLRHPGLRFAVASAEDLPDDLGRFDGALCVNALHHVAPQAMQPALRRVLARLDPPAPLLVIEPLPEGSFFHAMLPVEDETHIRDLAARAIAGLVDDGDARLVDLLRWNRISLFSGLDAFLDRLVAVDPDRAATLDRNRPAIEAAWSRHAQPTEHGFRLVQPIVGWHLAPPG